MLGMQELVDVADVEVIGTNRLRLPFADATVGQVDFGEWPLPVLISRSFAAGDTFVTSTQLRGQGSRLLPQTMAGSAGRRRGWTSKRVAFSPDRGRLMA